MSSTETARLVVLDPSIFYYHALQIMLAPTYAGAPLYVADETSARQVMAGNCALVLIGPNWTPPKALHLCRAVRHTKFDAQVVIVSAVAEEPLFQIDAAYSGASACLNSSAEAETLADTLNQVERGATLFAPKIIRAAHQLPGPTKRELELLCLLAQDKTDSEIADELCMSEHTVGAHLRNIFRKMDAHDRKEAVRRARHRGWV